MGKLFNSDPDKKWGILMWVFVIVASPVLVPVFLWNLVRGKK